MPKHYRVTPRLLAGSAKYIANFRNARAERVTRSLGTADAGQAELISAGLAMLWRLGVRDPSQVPADVPGASIRLYFASGDKREALADHVVFPLAPSQAGDVAAAMAKAAQEPVGFALKAMAYEEQIERQRLKIAEQAQHMERERSDHEALKRSAVGQAVMAAKSVPPIAEAMIQFEKHMTTSAMARRKNEIMLLSKRFVATLPPIVKTLADVPVATIAAWIDETVAAAASQKPASYRRHLRINLGRLFNWSAGRWRYPTQMTAVPVVERNAVERERGDIHWHTLAEIQAALAGIPQRLRIVWDAEVKAFTALAADAGDAADALYWQALVATLAFAGLQLAELVWLRKADLTVAEDGSRGSLWVTTVEESATVRHTLKTGHRKRQVDLHPQLLPLLRDHIAGGRAGAVYLFPVPPSVRPRARKINAGLQERWMVGSLSTKLRGHVGGSKRLPSARILPERMHAKSLRRTFGSLLLRAGKSSAEVAAAMGNTEDVVRQHYARILGGEVDVDF